MLREIIEDMFNIKLPKRSALWGIIYNTVCTDLEFHKDDDTYFAASIIADDVEREVKKYIEKYYVEK